MLSATPSALSLAQRANSRSVQFPLRLKLRLAHPFLLSAIPSRVGIALSSPFSRSETHKFVYFLNPTGQTVENFLGNIQSKFEDDPMVNESRIAILLE